MDGQTFQPDLFGAGSSGGGIGDIIRRILGGGGPAGNSVPGLCFLPGACPSVPIPSILDFLPHGPAQGCEFGPCNNDPSGIGNGFLGSGLAPLSSAFLGNFLANNIDMIGICTPIPPLQFVEFGTPGCNVGCEFVRTYPSNPQPLLGSMHISPGNLYSACGHLSRCPDIILVEGSGEQGKVFSCSKIVPPLTFPPFPIGK